MQSVRLGPGTRTGAEGLGVLLEELGAHEFVQVPVLLAAPPPPDGVAIWPPFARQSETHSRPGDSMWAVKGTLWTGSWAAAPEKSPARRGARPGSNANKPISVSSITF